ncbi:hypothetical protein K7X08_031428 [Anisodus acutangulus]|uniref:Protein DETOXIFICATION n=1 Tax=Anisodus acutangulus TaxID=402998 RepID=A0A9Q1MPB9_9SOLA|nr:hypothetical protein K7X08_031428 [Anisodus acutangulus]
MSTNHVEEGLLLRKLETDEENIGGIRSWVVEVKRIGYLAGPMAAVTLSQYLLQVISLLLVGHLGELYLSSTAVAFSLSSVTCFTLLIGMASALETLGGQAYGAHQYKEVGTQTYTAIFSLFIVSIPISIVWIYMEYLLIFMGQDPQISHEAGRFLMYLLPAFFGYATLQPLIRYYLMQSMIIPLLISSCLTIAIHVPLCWFLVYQSGLKNIGAALSMDVSLWMNVAILASYMRYSPACEKTRVPISWEIFDGMKEFFKFAIPSAVMICLEGWSFEIIIVLSGLLPNPQLETSVLSVCLNILSTLYSIPYGLSAAVSTRVSNELGAGNPQGARTSVIIVMLLAVIEAIVASTTLFSCRYFLGYIFSNEKEVVEYLSNLAPLVCLSVIMDTLQATLSGVARGCGWQHIGAYVNLASFYLFGVPIAALLGFYSHLRAKGLWKSLANSPVKHTTSLLRTRNAEMKYK